MFINHGITEESITDIAPIGSLLFFQSGDSVVATYHELDLKQNKPVLKAGRSVSLADVQGLLQTMRHFDKKSQALSLHQKAIIASGYDSCVWFSPPKIAPMWFSGSSRAMLNVPWPGLIYAVSNARLYVFAVKNRAKVTLNTPLYHAPLMNIYQDGKLCFGNVDKPHYCDISNLESWERLITDSNFTHINHNHTIQVNRGTATTSRLFNFWKGLDIKRTQKVFPVDKLVPVSRTVGDLINALNGGCHD